MTVLSSATCCNRVYQLMGTGVIYYYDLETGTYALYTTVPVLPQGINAYTREYSDLNSEEKGIIDSAVFQLIDSVDDDVLYGYSTNSGMIERWCIPRSTSIRFFLRKE